MYLYEAALALHHLLNTGKAFSIDKEVRFSSSTERSRRVIYSLAKRIEFQRRSPATRQQGNGSNSRVVQHIRTRGDVHSTRRRLPEQRATRSQQRTSSEIERKTSDSDSDSAVSTGGERKRRKTTLQSLCSRGKDPRTFSYTFFYG